MPTALAEPPELSAEWRDLICSLPGYDPFAQSDGCEFVPAAAQKAVDFIHLCCRHVEGELAGQPFLLERWQQAFVANLFGWKKSDSRGRKVRRYRETLLYVPRKCGKTPLAAAIALYVFFADNEPGCQAYCAAADVEQASLLFRHARGMIDQEPEMSRRSLVYRALRSIVLKSDPASSFKVLSAEADTKHGGNSHLVLIDELHAQPNRELVDVLLTSMASANRRQPLIVFITTADFQRDSICNEKYDYACKVRDGIVHDPAFLPVIYEATLDDDWRSPEVWEKANPNLGISVSREYLERECKRAAETPAYENTFKRLHLNIRTEQDVRWLPMDRWDAELCSAEFDPETLAGQECYAGLDLASTTDLTAFVLAFPREDGSCFVLPYFWCPESAAKKRERENKTRYDVWIRQGFMHQTPGDVTDYDRVRNDILDLWKKYDIRKVAIDRWNASQLAVQLQGEGLDVEFFGQGYASMSAPSKELEGLVVSGRLKHGGHPVLRWMASNVYAEIDAAGNIKPSKKKSTEKIDGIVALTMALGMMIARPVASKYDSGGLEYL